VRGKVSGRGIKLKKGKRCHHSSGPLQVMFILEHLKQVSAEGVSVGVGDGEGVGAVGIEPICSASGEGVEGGGCPEGVGLGGEESIVGTVESIYLVTAGRVWAQ
jgi:hypothetical protein